MAKGQKRGNKEPKKQKQPDKVMSFVSAASVGNAKTNTARATESAAKKVAPQAHISFALAFSEAFENGLINFVEN